MAAGQHKLSRRVLLGAVCAAPVLSRHSGLDPASTFFPRSPQGRWIPDQVRDDEEDQVRDDETWAVPVWDRALLRFHRAEAALKAAASEPDQDLYDALLDASLAALRSLLRTPAPHLPALAAKLTLAIAHEAWELTGGDLCMAAIEQDGRRLGLA